MADLSNACRRRQLDIKMTQYADGDQGKCGISAHSSAEKGGRSCRQLDREKPPARHIHRLPGPHSVRSQAEPEQRSKKGAVLVKALHRTDQLSPPKTWITAKRSPKGIFASSCLANCNRDGNPPQWPSLRSTAQSGLRSSVAKCRAQASVEGQRISQPAPMTRFA
ncbi:hypothetical protein BDP55DRAFT_718271 [Colletotrichum godetiae]|uniref:Uncharacterized protein n=1 Tax=Colletotrichum godetiae TaxID=1209918 RepID=A0AAJ0AE02_9PEZI|nr:uncharacterized protein BDP55DRAFT_718271 [Colletotrichum godetiae]KAK1672139.1 hypothetical protein BDP55DRAFT_718271 [Colletotrichum godetiae]